MTLEELQEIVDKLKGQLIDAEARIEELTEKLEENEPKPGEVGASEADKAEIKTLQDAVQKLKDELHKAQQQRDTNKAETDTLKLKEVKDAILKEFPDADPDYVTGNNEEEIRASAKAVDEKFKAVKKTAVEDARKGRGDFPDTNPPETPPTDDEKAANKKKYDKAIEDGDTATVTKMRMDGTAPKKKKE